MAKADPSRSTHELFVPDIGEPHPRGGACRVVDRIQRQVDSPQDQDRLIRQVRTGADLSNDDAREIYGEKTPGGRRGKGGVAEESLSESPGMMYLLYHALHRMDLRSVRSPEVRAAVDAYMKELSAAKKAYESLVNDRARKNGISSENMHRVILDQIKLKPDLSSLSKEVKDAWKRLAAVMPKKEGDKIRWVYRGGKKPLVIVLVIESPRGNTTVRLATTFTEGEADPGIPPGGCDEPSGRVERHASGRIGRRGVKRLSWFVLGAVVGAVSYKASM